MILYDLFTAFVVISFLWFGRQWMLEPRRWHIGWMSFSYAGMIRCVELHGGHGRFLDYLRVIVYLSGLLGLGRYWLYDMQLAWKFFRMRNGKRKLNNLDGR